MSTNVLIGICDLEIIKDKNTAWSLNKIGGYPDWMHMDVEANCSSCSRALYLICQLYCPLQQSPLHRTLYIFACSQILCWNNSKTWMVLRCNKLSEPAITIKKSTKESSANVFDVSNMDWGADSLELCGFDEEIINQETLQIVNTISNIKLSDMKLNDEPYKTESNSNDNQCFKSYYINVFSEEECASAVDDDDDYSYENQLLKNYLKNEGITFSVLESQNANSSEDGKNNCLNKTINRNFLKYQKAIQKCPNQIIRYSYNGQELLINEKRPEIENCECGAKRIFELQLMPSLLNCLHLNDSCEPKNFKLEFSNVLVYTCSANCWSSDTSDQYKKEHVYIEVDDTSLNNLNLKLS